MAIKYPTKDGKVVLEGERAHASIRGASSGFASSNDSSHALAVGYVYDMARRSYSIYRSFFCFDTSDITSTISSATFGVRGSTNSSADTIIVKSDAFGGDCGTTLANGDYNNLDFTTPYSSERTSWNTNSAYNDFTLNSTALLDVKNNNSFTLALIEHDYDYSNVDGRGYQVKNGLYYVDNSGVSSDPKLTYTLAGYDKDIIGVASADIVSVIGVATADIDNVIGV